MKKILLTSLLTLFCSSGWAQSVSTWPPPAGTIAFLGVYNSSPPTYTSGQPGYVQLDVNGNLKVNVTNTPTVITSSLYPNAATPITAANTGTTSAVTATLPGVSGKTTYICGFTITADATALATGTATVTGPVSGTMSYIQAILAATTGVSQLSQNFNPCIPANTTSTSIVVQSAAAGSGGNTAVDAWGYQQ